MDEMLASEVIKWYKYLEKQFTELMEYVPLTEENRKTFWSFRLAMIITDAGNILDSLFRYELPQKIKVDGKQKDKSDLNIVDFAKLYADKFKLPLTKTIFLVSPPEYRIPFKDWEDIIKGGEYKRLSWWEAYTDLKHNRLSNIEEKAILNNTIDALCGLLQVIAKLLVQATLRHGLMQCSANVEMTCEELKKHSVSSSDTWIETQLFAVYLGRQKLPDDINKFSPSTYGGSRRLIKFFGRY